MSIQAIYLGAVIFAYAVFALTLAYASIWTSLDPLAKAAKAGERAAPIRGKPVNA